MEKEYLWNIMECPNCHTVFAIPTYDFTRHVDNEDTYDLKCYGCEKEFSARNLNQGTMKSNRGLKVEIVKTLSDKIDN